MTVTAATTRNDYTATSGQTVFPYTFTALADSDIKVLKNGVAISLGVDFAISGVPTYGGNVTLTTGATLNDKISVYLDMPLSRTTNYQNSGDFLALDVNGDFNKLWIALQQTETDFDRAIRRPLNEAGTISMQLPAVASRAGRLLTFDSAGAVAMKDYTDTTLTTINVDTFTGNGTTTTFTITSSKTNASMMQVNIDGIIQHVSTYTLTNKVVTLSEAPPFNALIEIRSFLEVDVTDLVGPVAAAAASALAAAGSATAAAGSATTAAGSVSDAAAQVSLATTQAGNAATSATNAASSESAVATSATNAANSATAAASSASGASTSATNANNSAIAAAASAASIGTDPSFNSVTVTGTTAVKMSAGTTAQRPTGVAGDFRYNTTEGKFEGYSTEWGEIGGGAADLLLNQFSGNGSIVAFTLSGAAVENNTLVYIDGVYQSKSNYTVSNATPAVVTFSTAPPNGTAIEIMVAAIAITNIGTPSDNTVSTPKIVDLAVTTGKIADGAITSAKLGAGVGGAFNDFAIKTADYTAVTRDQLIVNSSSAVTITLPASPSAGNVVFIKNAGAGVVTVGRNGSNINSQAQDGTLAADAGATLVYVDATIGWKEL